MRRLGTSRSSDRKNRRRKRDRPEKQTQAKPQQQTSEFYGGVNLWWTSEQ